MNLLVDVHSHLDHSLLIDKIDEIIHRAKSIGLKHVITNGINPETNRKCLELSKKYDIVKCAMGIYPRNALKNETESGEYPFKLDNCERVRLTNEAHSHSTDFDADEEINFIRKNKNNIAAISEVGLDFVHGENRQQIEDFEKMIKLAEELKKPIVIHSRKAEQKCVEMLESSTNKKIVMHCFSGKKFLVKRITDNGWFLTAPTIVVRSQQFQDIAKNVPITQLFCETDSPYLSPYKERLNEPAFVIESYSKIAEIKNMDVNEVMNNIYMNWQKVFE
ncbi:TatD family hydrolase [Candidatus Woesearchaeota archaeon]|nr:TatD family hydrolase [Candidatus Woesearchaeota archaeon]